MTQRIIREGTLILCFLTGLFLFIALLTYSPSDPGFSTTGDGGDIDNAVGQSGAWIADLLLYLFGFLAYIFPVTLGLKVVALLRQSDQAQEDFSWAMFWLKTAGVVLLAVGACALATMHFEIAEDGAQLAGGIIGASMVDVTVPVFAVVGSTILYFAIFLLGLTITVEISWLRFIDRTGYLTLHLFTRSGIGLRDWLATRKEEQDTRQIVETRKRALDVYIEKEKKRVPPAIAPVAKAAPAKSARVEKERQGRLFTTPNPGDLPAISLLDEWKGVSKAGYSKESLEAMSRLLELKLNDFGIEIQVTAVNPGPVITRFEVQPAPGIKASRISGLGKDLARSLALVSVRVVEVIPGKTVIGIEIPNEHREMIMLSQVLASPDFDKFHSPVSMALGHDIVGNPVIVDLAKMPHLLVAGTTGSGKSVGVNAMILSLLFKSTPQEVRLIMIDPKMLELSVYDGIPHLLTPVITDMKDAANGLRWCVAEMERRYKLMSALGVRNLAGYNKKVTDAIKAGQSIVDPLWRPDPMQLLEEQSAPMLESLPMIVVIVDELADMMMVVGKKVEELIARIAQKARAAGIHLILATQRPSVDVLTGLIKANIPTRLSFMVQSKIDSRTILGEGGAEQLLGNGDMLFLPPGGGVATRVHGAFVSDEEVHRVVADWKSRGEPVYIEEITQGADERDYGGFGGGDEEAGEEDDALYDEAVAFVTESRKASISAVQRKLRIGYNRAARMIEAMEAAGVVSAMNTNGSREVIAPPPR
ncbi:MAG: DNA translocase FtsK 4TM domain-containing protein [Gammaproteobacteria bacterium]|nr:DNA translocase FtsK 4TM domain-containing protein [Gammaproteobacteria bacterium]MDP2141191.1 DNA translocase FtsK 4TM domain-containing protein [Gammaproteobacteria bacterium]MDP2349135.1 DNA translocase FtsK 4TM domain-containing protein [Gammaproteobacteria bacterium]